MRSYRAIALTISTSIFMQFNDSTALTTAVPAIARALQVPVLHMDIAILANQIALVVFVPAGTVIAGRIGARNAFTLALFVFMCGSLLCAISPSLAMLALARTIQGAGGAVMLPIGRLIVVRSARKSELISALNWLLVPGILGPMFGPAMSGFIVQYASWHWIFLINVPIALIGIAMTLAVVPDIREEKVEAFDRKGALLLSPFIICMVLGLGGMTGRHPALVTAGLLLAALLLGRAYFVHVRTATAPILDLSLMRIASFRHSMLASTILRMAYGASGFILPLWFQLAMHKSSSETGILLVMTSFGALISRVTAGPLLRIAHPRTMAIFGAAGLGLMMLVNSSLQADWPQPVFLLLLLLQGLAVAGSLLVIAPAAYVDLSPEQMTAGTTFYATVQQLTMSLGVIVGLWTITAMRWFTGATPQDNATYSGSMVAIACMTFLAAFIARKLDADTLAALRPEARPA